MDARFINPVLHSIVNVLSTMAQLEPRPARPSLKEGTLANGVVTGLIALEGERTNGSVAISLTEPVALDIAERMLRTKFTECDEMVQDLVGELANMMAGGAKSRLEEDGFSFDLTLPTVLKGDRHAIEHTIDGPIVLLPFHTDAGEFYVEICFKQ